MGTDRYIQGCDLAGGWMIRSYGLPVLEKERVLCQVGDQGQCFAVA